MAESEAEEKKNKCLVVDGNGVLYSSFHVFKKVNKEIPHGTAFFFFSVLISLLKKENYQEMILVFDLGKDERRLLLLPDYKKQRPSAPEELIRETRVIRQVLEDCGLYCLDKRGWEADDLIASFIAQHPRHSNTNFLVFSRDKDLFQLISERVSLLKYVQGSLGEYTKSLFEQDYGFTADLFVDYLTLVGDKVDNIPGVKGVGESTAKKIIRELGSLTTVYEQLDRLPSSLKKTFQINRETIKKIREVVKLNPAVPIDPEVFQKTSFEREVFFKNSSLVSFCEKHNFKSILRRLLKET